VPSGLVRWGAIGAVIAGVAWAVSGVFAFVFPGEQAGPLGSTSAYLIESAHAIAEAGMLAALAGLHVLQARSLGRLGVAGFAVAFVGTALVLVSTLLIIIFLDRPGETLLTVLFASGVLGWLVGFVLFGIATFRAKVLPRWCGLLLIAYIPLFLFLLNYSYDLGGIALGLLWLALGYALWTQRGTAAQPSRVS
jgi:hypothetical protein